MNTLEKTLYFNLKDFYDKNINPSNFVIKINKKYFEDVKSDIKNVTNHSKWVKFENNSIFYKCDSIFAEINTKDICKIFEVIFTNENFYKNCTVKFGRTTFKGEKILDFKKIFKCQKKAEKSENQDEYCNSNCYGFCKHFSRFDNKLIKNLYEYSLLPAKKQTKKALKEIEKQYKETLKKNSPCVICKYFELKQFENLFLNFPKNKELLLDLSRFGDGIICSDKEICMIDKRYTEKYM